MSTFNARNLFPYRFLRKALAMAAVGLCCIGCSSDEHEELPIDNTPHLNVSDSLAMVNIYEAIGPWGNKWDLEDIQTWGGVTIALDLDKNEYRIVGFEYYGGSFHGFFPDDFRQLTELRRLAVCGGTLGGNIPPWIGELKHLEYLAISDNNIVGEIPESIGELKNLQKLSIVNNHANGKIPPVIGNLDNLTHLYIYNTEISGDIPSTLANLKQAKRILLSDNQLSGEFPIEILRDGLYVGCEGNNITELSFDVWNDQHPNWLPNLQRNRLSGTLPESVISSKKWKENKILVKDQQEGYGYSNYDN